MEKLGTCAIFNLHKIQKPQICAGFGQKSFLLCVTHDLHAIEILQETSPKREFGYGKLRGGSPEIWSAINSQRNCRFWPYVVPTLFSDHRHVGTTIPTSQREGPWGKYQRNKKQKLKRLMQAREGSKQNTTFHSHSAIPSLL